jgi:hypothetical protein
MSGVKGITEQDVTHIQVAQQGSQKRLLIGSLASVTRDGSVQDSATGQAYQTHQSA